MQSMSDDDAAYSALLTQLLSDSAPSRNARVHSWIEHQYDFALSEEPVHLPFVAGRPPSPSPSSSLGARRTCSIDRPDSPLLPRCSLDRPSSPCPSYDALFFPHPSHRNSEEHAFEEQERIRALRFLVQEMVHSKSQAIPPSPHHSREKVLPAPPPSPASSFTQSTSSRAMRSRSSSNCISRLPSFTSTLSSEQSQPQEIPPPLPVSVILHGEYQHDLVLRHSPVDSYLHKRDGSLFTEQDGQYLCPDDKDSIEPSPTLSNFSCAYSRETSFTTPYASSPASPSSAVFSCSPCSPEDIALPASPVDDQPFLRESPKPNLLLASSVVQPSPPAPLPRQNVLHTLRTPQSLEYSQSRWSIATTASLAQSNMESKSGIYPGSRTPPKERKEKAAKTPKKRARFISLISRFSPGRTDNASGQTDDVEYDSANDSDTEEKGRVKQRKTLTKKSSLASLRASFSLSRASFSSQRPPISSPIAEVPPLPISPTPTSPLSEVFSSPTRPSLPKRPSRANLLNTPLPPIPQSASTVATFPCPSQLSVSAPTISPAESRLSLVCTNSTPNMSRVSLLPSISKRASLTSLAGVEPIVRTGPISANRAVARSKSIFRLTAKPKSLKIPTTGTSGAAMPSKLPIAASTSLSSPVTTHSRIPQIPNKFIPPAKLATVIATQSRRVPSLGSPGPTSPTSKLPMPPSRAPKLPRYITAAEKQLPDALPPSSKLPMPPSARGGVRVGTVKGFWKRQ